MNRLLALVILILSFGATSVEARQAEWSRSMTTSEVWQHHIDSWDKRDLSKILSDYDCESILILNGKIYRGAEQISKVFSSLFRIFDRGENQINPVVIHDRVVYITWHFRPTGLDVQYGTDTFVIEHGKIKVQTIASPLYDLIGI